MPLSEDEQRILHEIERQFQEQDPKFAAEVEQATLYRHSGRIIRLAALGFIAGLVLLVWQFSTSLLFGFVGFLIMLGCAVVIERHLRLIGRAGLQQLSMVHPENDGPGPLESARQRLRQRFNRDE